MTDIVRDTIAAELARIAPVARVPRPPLGYGTDLSCGADFTARMSVVDPLSTQGLAESIIRRLDTPKGVLSDATDWGIDLRSYLHRGVTVQSIRRLEEVIRAEIALDDRYTVERVRVSSADFQTLTVQITVRPEPSDQSFSLVFIATSAELILQEITS